MQSDLLPVVKLRTVEIPYPLLELHPIDKTIASRAVIPSIQRASFQKYRAIDAQHI